MATNNILAWHFVNKTLRDGSPIPPDGEWLKHTGDIELCASGYHASNRVIDALQYAPGATLCLVELRGNILHGKDKMVASERKILWRMDATDLLGEASRRWALEVIHLWNAPDVVKQFLETGDESLRAAAWAAVTAAAWGAAQAAARAAAWDAAWAAARAAAWAAAWAAARPAAQDAQESILQELITKYRPETQNDAH